MMKLSFTSACSVLLFALLLSCSQKKAESETAVQTEAEAPIDYELAQEKVDLTKYFELEHIKEWYPTRVLPQVFDFNVDLTNKTPVELWLLRNEIFARNGYLFTDATLRGHFNQFKWYQPIFDVPEFKVQLNKKEQEFIERVSKREAELASTKIIKQGSYDMVNFDHVYNQIQFKSIPAPLQALLSKNNFAIVPADHGQLFYVYDHNHYGYIPNFITTDLYLQVLHKHLGSTLRNLEEANLLDLVTGLLKRMHTQSQNEKAASAQWARTYVGIAYSLIVNQVQSSTDPMLAAEFKKVLEGEGVGSDFLQAPLFNYQAFQPRGYYTTTEELKSYFRCVKWLNSAPIDMDSDEGLMSAVYLAAWIKGSPENLQDYTRFNDVIQLIAGEEDNASISTLVNIITVQEAAQPDQFNSTAKLQELRLKIRRTSINRIKTGASTERMKQKILFTAGRYTFDSEIFSRLVHVLQPKPKRLFPKGLDIFAALGNKTARAVLTQEFEEEKRWPAYTDSISALQNDLPKMVQWEKNVYTKTFEAINALNEGGSGTPLYTKTPQWAKRNLSTALGAWAQLRHDVVLYAETPYYAQAGEGGGPPPPAHVSYVEPNLLFWSKVLELLDLEQGKLASLNLLDANTKGVIDELREIGTLLLNISKKQLSNEKITPDEFEDMSYIGGRIEYLTFHIAHTDHLPSKERLISEVVDVYNYNGNLLEEAVGLADEIYVVVEINGKPHLAKGAVFSYYEFTSNMPLTDERWQTMLIELKAPPRPSWLKEIMVEVKPLESKPSYSF